MSGEVRLSDIEYGIRAGLAAVEALRTWVKGVEAYRICDERERALREAERAMTALEKVWPKAKALIASSEREYDRYVTSEPQGCSCHLSAPCSFCTMQVEDFNPDDMPESECGAWTCDDSPGGEHVRAAEQRFYERSVA